MNIDVETYTVFYGATIGLVARKPDSISDTKYSRENLRVTINVEKFLSGNRGNAFTAFLFEQATKAFEFEPKFPVEKVSLNIKKMRFNVSFSGIFLQGIYHVRNMSFPGAMMPRSSPFMGEVTAMIKIKNDKGKFKIVKCFKIEVYGKLNM